VDAKKLSPSYLALRILRKLQTAPLHQTMAIADHQKATDAMLNLRDLMVNGLHVDRDVAACLTCAGIAVHRRILIGPEQLGAAQHVQTTQALLFVLVVLASVGNEASPAGEDLSKVRDEYLMNLSAWESNSLWEQIRSADDDVATSSWARALREPGTICQAILKIVRTRVKEPSLEELSQYGGTFFRASAAAMAVALLDSVAPVFDGNDFLTLDAVAFVHQVPENALRVERLQGIADCAESEAGQTVLRDLILSFKLPRKVVGVRRTALLGRESNRIATESHHIILSAAHDCAMRGARWTWDKDEDPLHKMCALLAGLAVQSFDSAQSVRKDDMYKGRVQLPFLETLTVEPSVQRLALLEHSHEWVVYSMNTGAQPVVRLRQAGFEGLAAAVLLFSSTMS
jgi:hypothetical protein